jgi:hypothetical protein
MSAGVRRGDPVCGPISRSADPDTIPANRSQDLATYSHADLGAALDARIGFDQPDVACLLPSSRLSPVSR